MGTVIVKEDMEKRAEWMRKGIRFFDAPAVLESSHYEHPIEVAETTPG